MAIRCNVSTAVRNGLVNNIVAHLLNGVSEPILLHASEYWRNVDKNLADRVARGRVRQAARHWARKVAQQTNLARSSQGPATDGFLPSSRW
jgi:catalase